MRQEARNLTRLRKALIALPGWVGNAIRTALMAAPYRRTKKIRKTKRAKQGKARKRRMRSKGSTPSLNKILGPSS
jgi:hypothetical protein